MEITHYPDFCVFKIPKTYCEALGNSAFTTIINSFSSIKNTDRIIILYHYSFNIRKFLEYLTKYYNRPWKINDVYRENDYYEYELKMEENFLSVDLIFGVSKFTKMYLEKPTVNHLLNKLQDIDFDNNDIITVETETVDENGKVKILELPISYIQETYCEIEGNENKKIRTLMLRGARNSDYPVSRDITDF
jgi:hypothetical protein